CQSVADARSADAGRAHRRGGFDLHAASYSGCARSPRISQSLSVPRRGRGASSVSPVAAPHGARRSSEGATMVVRATGFIGVGLMGQPMAVNLARSEVPLKVWNRTPEKLEPAIAAGAVPVRDVEEIFASCEAIFLMLST